MANPNEPLNNNPLVVPDDQPVSINALSLKTWNEVEADLGLDKTTLANLENKENKHPTVTSLTTEKPLSLQRPCCKEFRFFCLPTLDDYNECIKAFSQNGQPIKNTYFYIRDKKQFFYFKSDGTEEEITINNNNIEEFEKQILDLPNKGDSNVRISTITADQATKLTNTYTKHTIERETYEWKEGDHTTAYPNGGACETTGHRSGDLKNNKAPQQDAYKLNKLPSWFAKLSEKTRHAIYTKAVAKLQKKVGEEKNKDGTYKYQEGGCTHVSAVLMRDAIDTSHLGDSNVFLIVADEKGTLPRFEQLTKPHTVDEKTLHAKKDEKNGNWRLWDQNDDYNINMSASLGDISIVGLERKPTPTSTLVTNIPNNGRALALVACDGIDTLTFEQLKAFFQEELQKDIKISCTELSKRLVEKALISGSRDNITVVICEMKPDSPEVRYITVHDGHGQYGQDIAKESSEQFCGYLLEAANELVLTENIPLTTEWSSDTEEKISQVNKLISLAIENKPEEIKQQLTPEYLPALLYLLKTSDDKGGNSYLDDFLMSVCVSFYKKPNESKQKDEYEKLDKALASIFELHSDKIIATALRNPDPDKTLILEAYLLAVAFDHKDGDTKQRIKVHFNNTIKKLSLSQQELHTLNRFITYLNMKTKKDTELKPALVAAIALKETVSTSNNNSETCIAAEIKQAKMEIEHLTEGATTLQKEKKEALEKFKQDGSDELDKIYTEHRKSSIQATLDRENSAATLKTQITLTTEARKKISDSSVKTKSRLVSETPEVEYRQSRINYNDWHSIYTPIYNWGYQHLAFNKLDTALREYHQDRYTLDDKIRFEKANNILQHILFCEKDQTTAKELKLHEKLESNKKHEFTVLKENVENELKILRLYADPALPAEKRTVTPKTTTEVNPKDLVQSFGSKIWNGLWAFINFFSPVAWLRERREKQSTDQIGKKDTGYKHSEQAIKTTSASLSPSSSVPITSNRRENNSQDNSIVSTVTSDSPPSHTSTSSSPASSILSSNSPITSFSNKSSTNDTDPKLTSDTSSSQSQQTLRLSS